MPNLDGEMSIMELLDEIRDQATNLAEHDTGLKRENDRLTAELKKFKAFDSDNFTVIARLTQQIIELKAKQPEPECEGCARGLVPFPKVEVQEWVHYEVFGVDPFPCTKSNCAHEWKIDGAHLNEYCGKCMISKPDGECRGCREEWETNAAGTHHIMFRSLPPPEYYLCTNKKLL